MPALRHWTKDLVYVLVPEESATEREVLNVARAASRVAILRDLTPMCPVLYFSGFASPEDTVSLLPRMSARWFRRASMIWLVYPTSDEYLDRQAYRLLEANERSTYPIRKPVYTLESNDGEIIPVVLSRDEIRGILDCNILQSVSAVG